MKILQLAALKGATRAEAETHLAGAVVRATFTPMISRADADAGEIADSPLVNFTISTPSVDRMGDVIALDGWQLDSYRKNPVVLWAHDSTLPPVARCVDVRVADGALRARVEFVPAEISTFADTVRKMYEQGFLSAVSVGFLPLKWAWVEADGRSGIDFLEAELLEFSAVPVPANAEALIGASLQPTTQTEIAGRDLTSAVSRYRQIYLANLRA